MTQPRDTIAILLSFQKNALKKYLRNYQRNMVLKTQKAFFVKKPSRSFHKTAVPNRRANAYNIFTGTISVNQLHTSSKKLKLLQNLLKSIQKLHMLNWKSRILSSTSK